MEKLIGHWISFIHGDRYGYGYGQVFGIDGDRLLVTMENEHTSVGIDQIVWAW